MNPPRRTYLLAGLPMLLVGLALSSTWVHAQDITMNSPFVPRPGTSMATPTENSQVELRGILKGDAGPIFGLYDPVKKQAGWMKVSEVGKDFPATIRSYDSANDAITVEYQGRVLSLALKTARIEAAPAMAMGGPPRPAPMPGQPAVMQAPSADDTRRLEAVAAEVARRRQARQAAAQQQPQPPPQVTPNMPNRQR